MWVGNDSDGGVYDDGGEVCIEGLKKWRANRSSIRAKDFFIYFQNLF